MQQLIKIVFRNKVLIYLISRYATYAIQFLNSIVIAVVLGPLYLAIWGFINLVLQYVAQLNLGIPYSLNVLLSINKNDDKHTAYLMNAGLILCSALFVVLFVVFISFYLQGASWMDKYSFSTYAFPIFVIAILTHFNSLFTNYYRVKNRLNEIIFFQSVIPVTTFFALILVKDKQMLLNVLLAIMFLGQFFSFLLFLRKYELSMTFKIQPYLMDIRLILKRGIYLFIYNACFYFMIISTRSIVSGCYQEIEFGYFTFSFTLANTVMLLFDSFSFLIYPKTINRLSVANQQETVRILDIIRDNYILIVHFVMYIFILLFPVVIYFFSAYQSTFKCFGLIVMTVVFYTNCFIYSSVLTARHKEIRLGMIAFGSLVINVLSALCIVYIFHLSYEYVILATMFAYVIYNILLTIEVNKVIRLSNTLKTVVFDNFPIKLFLPFVVCLCFIIAGLNHFYYGAVLILFLLLNKNDLWNIRKVINQIIQNPQITNV